MRAKRLSQRPAVGHRPAGPVERGSPFVRATRRLLAYTILTLGAAGALAPFVWMVSTSLKAPEDVFGYPPQWIPDPFVWGNYLAALRTVPFGRFFANSLIVATSVTLLQLLTSALAGFAFARIQFPGRDKLFMLYLGTLMIPFQVTLVPNYILMVKLDWIDTYRALILPQAFTAFGTFLLRQHFLSIPPELEDAARIDGASTFDIWARIMMPLSGAPLAALGVFMFMGQWNNLFWPLVVTTEAHMRTLPVGLSYFRGQYGTQWNLLMAGTTVALLPVLLVFIAGQKYFVRGIALTGISGR